jgi:hypothetical protein
MRVHAEPSHWLHETFVSKTVWPWLMAGSQTVGQSLPNAKHLEHLLYFGVAAAIGQAWTLLEFTALYSMPAVTLGTRLWPLLGGCYF